jgi:hypothetical protein
MVRIALMRMMADEERENAHNAACLTKFAELLVLNDILTTEQMWRAFSLVGDMYHSSGARGCCCPCYYPHDMWAAVKTCAHANGTGVLLSQLLI